MQLLCIDLNTELTQEVNPMLFKATILLCLAVASSWAQTGTPAPNSTTAPTSATAPTTAATSTTTATTAATSATAPTTAATSTTAPTTAATSTTTATTAATSTTAPTTAATSTTAASFTTTFPSCEVAEGEAVDPVDIIRRLNSGELSFNSTVHTPSSTGATRAKRIVLPPVPLPECLCENGPIDIIHNVPGEFHWPPIIRGSCHNLFCKDPPCIVRKKILKTKCVYVFKIINGKPEYIGPQQRNYIDDLQCGCKTCNDITNYYACSLTRPCPNSRVKDSFCIWKTKNSTCECCKPIDCPPGQIFNRKTCECDCPPGSKRASNGKCIGNCEEIDLYSCPSVFCADNEHLKCKVENHSCVCQSCDDVTNTLECTRTNCVEMRTKPPCRVDPCTKKCRCPNCKEQPDIKWCKKIYCGPNYHLQCSWNPFHRSCFCPH